MNKENFRTIRKAIENNKLAIFVGSGISYDSNLPSWGELVKSMQQSLESTRLKSEEYLKIAEHYYIQYGKNTYYNKINDYFPKNSQPNHLHELILSLKPQHIITTNWDDLLEKAINKKGDLYFTVATDNDLASSPSAQLLVKMHGDLVHRNIVFKESDYLSYSDNFPLIENFVKSLFSTHIVVFLGYSLSDFNLNQILNWIRNRTQDAPPSFSILTDKKIVNAELNFLVEKGIYPILSENITISDPEIYPTLSEKSKLVATIINNIVSPDVLEGESILEEIVNDISEWEIIYPTNFVNLIKERFNISEINKVYFDSEERKIYYKLGSKDRVFSRTDYRRIRKLFKLILTRLPVIYIELEFSYRKSLKIKNTFEFELEDEYTQFKAINIFNRASLSSFYFNDNIDAAFQFAFDNYYTGNIKISKDSYLHLANLYFIRSKYVKSLISSFNKKNSSFGELPYELWNEEFFEVFMKEQLLSNDNISEIVEKFPKSILNRNKVLYQGIDFDNTFLLARHKEISSLSREMEKDLQNINNRAIVLNRKLSSIYHQIYCIVLFIIKNKVAIFYDESFREICRIGFEAIIKRLLLTSTIQIDILLSLLAIYSYSQRDLVDFLSYQLVDATGLEIKNEAFNYIINILNNSLECISIEYSQILTQRSINVWSNALTILSYSRHDLNEINQITECLESAMNIDKWYVLTDVINTFLVLQVRKFQSSFPPERLISLLNKHLDNINFDRQHIGIRGQLFGNLVHLINQFQEGSPSLFEDEQLTQMYVLKISRMQLLDKVNSIYNFVFVMYSFASEQVRSNLRTLLINTYNEFCEHDPSPRSIIYGLDLYELELLNDDDFHSIMGLLSDITIQYLERNSTTGYFKNIQDKLQRISSELLTNYMNVLSDLDTLVNRLSLSIYS